MVVARVRTRVDVRLHMLVENAFSVSMRPSVHPPGEVECADQDWIGSERGGDGERTRTRSHLHGRR